LKDTKNIKNKAIQTILSEAESIRSLVHSINADFINCVKEILKCKGRVIVTGIGKSAIVGNKIVSTFNSTGTPSVFMHAADAIHGDMGIIQKEDIVICISYSGNTPEIKALLPQIKKTGCKTIGITGNKNSYLGENVTNLLNVKVKNESGLENMLPTNSTTATMVMGDALAVCLLECRGFTVEDFGKLHPGGQIGKKIYLRIKDICTQHENPNVFSDTPVNDVILEITSKRLGAAVVTDKSGTVLGIVTDGDLRRMLEKNKNFSRMKAIDIMSKNPRTIDYLAYAAEAIPVIKENKITQVIALKDGKLFGVVHIHDLIKEGLL